MDSPQGSPSSDAAPNVVDTLIVGSTIVTMNADRDVLDDGAVAIRGTTIHAVGTTSELAAIEARETIDGSRFVLVPGLVNAHIHVTAEPVTRGVVPDDTPFEENVFGWLSPLGAACTEHDERISAQLAAAEMLKSGTTAFLEAGTGWYLDAVVEALEGIGIRARVGRRVWDRPQTPAKFRQSTAEAIANLDEVLTRYRNCAGGRIRGWATIVGHTTCTDALWTAARELADEHETGLNFHMSPASMDPEGFLSEFGQRPIEHLDDLGVLRDDTVIVHCVHLDDHEVAILGHRRCNIAHCPTTALKVAYGVTQIGKMPELVDAGANLCIGTDGNNASNYSDMYRATYLVAGLFKDARRDASVFPAEQVFEMATLGGARALCSEREIGSIEVGKRADLVLHDRDRPEWTPLLNVANQLVYAADGRSVHTVFVDGRKVVDNYRLTTVDEDRLYREAQAAGEALVRRSRLRGRTRWRTDR